MDSDSDDDDDIETSRTNRRVDNREEFDSDEEDEEDDDEEEDEEEEEERFTKHKKKKRRPINPFIEEEAAVDEDDDEEEEYEDDEEALGEAELAEEAQRSFADDARHREYDRKKQEQDDMKAEEIAELMKNRYKRNNYSKGFEGDIEHVSQRLLIPSVNDPKLWLVKCRPGKEKEIVLNLMRKFFDLQFKEQPITILSAFYRESLNGYLYIEADKQAHVQHAIDKMVGLYGSSLKLVPINEMVDCLTIKKKDLDLKPGNWVRVKKGRKYDGDLAQILEVGDSQEMVKIKIVPRIDYSRNRNGEKRKKSQMRPAPKFFSPDLVEDKRDLNSLRHHYWSFNGDVFDPNGYMEKEVKVSSLTVEGVNPTLEEITKYNGSSVGSERDLKALAEANLHSIDDFEVGENVESISGDMMGVQGVVKSVENGIVSVVPKGDLRGLKPMQFAARMLKKKFSEGEHVKVCNGVHRDETGMILNISDDVANILSDSTNTTFSVFIRDIKVSPDVNVGSASIDGGKYEMYDLVMISSNEVGVITKIEKDLLIVLNHLGNIVKIRPQQVMKKLDNKRAVTTDMNNNPVQANDSVHFSDHHSRGAVELSKRGTIMHVYRSFVFIRSRELVENSGVIVCKSGSVSILGGKTSTDHRRDAFAQPQGRGFGGGRGRGRGRGRGGRDPLLQKTVIITGGPYKGYVGICKDFHNDVARVELHTKNKTVNVSRDQLQIPGQTGPLPGSNDYNYSSNTRNDYYDSGRNRGSYDRGNRTPAWNSGSKTPAWDAGSKTPAWDAGSKTPAWDAGSKTPAWDAGSKTPAWDSGSKTPAWDPREGRTPRPAWERESIYNSMLADTPGGPGETPFGATPGDVQTPFLPQTPGGFPNTPAGPAATPYGGGYPGANTTTPFPATPFEGSTPAPMAASSSYGQKSKQTIVNWQIVDVEVQIVNFGQHDGDRGCIESPPDSSKQCRVYIYDSRETISIPISNLQPVVPEKRDSVKVTGGDMVDMIGQLLTKDESDGVVKIRGHERDHKVISLKHLAKLSEERK